MLTILPIDSGRYGTKEMLSIFDEEQKIRHQLEIESAVATTQAKLNLIPSRAAEDILNVVKSSRITINQLKKLETKNEHDTASLIEAISNKCKKDTKPWVHYGLTSNDLVDTSNSMQIRDALKIIQTKISKFATLLATKATTYKNLPAVGRTHGQHASIISFGLKFANWGLEMLKHYERIEECKKRILICKTLGVVGTGSLMGVQATNVQKMVSKILELYPIEVATQVIPRERYSEYIFQLALVGSTLDKISIEIRNLQRTEIGEVQEYFKSGQVGSSAVPIKRNPIKSERISSLSKLLRGYLITSFENIALWHERDLSNSANERFIIPTCTILLDEMLETAIKIIDNMIINKNKILRNINLTGGRIFSEFIMQELIKKGVSRLSAYRTIQKISFNSSESEKDYVSLLQKNKIISSNLTKDDINNIFLPNNHLGASSTIIDNACRMIQKRFANINIK